MVARMRVVVLLQAIVIVVLIGAVAYLGRDEIKLRDDTTTAEAKQTPVVRVSDQGTPVVAITDELREGSGVEVAPVQAGTARRRTTLTGVVVSSQALLEQVGRWRAAQSDDAAAQAEMKRARTEYERVSALFKDDRNASERTVQSAEAAYRSATARTAASRDAVLGQQARIRNEWGVDPARAHGPIESLAAQRQVLVQLALSPGDQEAPTIVRIRPAGGGDEREARLLGPGAVPEAALSGATFLYVVAATGLRAGMRVVAQVPAQEAAGGFLVPASALVWHAGRAWVYVKIPEATKDDDEEFARHDVTAGAWQGDGWFTSALPAGAEIVTTGAQLLLSEEQRGLIKNENDD